MLGRWLWAGILVALLLVGGTRAEEDELEVETVEKDLGSSREGSRTDSEVRTEK